MDETTTAHGRVPQGAESDVSGISVPPHPSPITTDDVAITLPADDTHQHVTVGIRERESPEPSDVWSTQVA